MEPQRYLRCLGQPALFTLTGEPIRFRTRKHLALLVYLAVEQRTQRRDRLAELLWPRVSATEARHSLATALSVLRPRVGLDALETSRDQARLVPGRVTLDLERLRAGDILGTEVSGPLEVAAFLDGFDINDSAEFTQWKDQQQARLLPVIKDAMLVLIDRCRRTGDTRQIEQVADRMLALDELSEEAIRAKMEARAFAGDRLTALEIFEAWKKKLAEELQAVPSELVEGIAVRLRRRGWERTTLANIPNVPTDQWRDRPFIGRAAEYKVLYEQWEATKQGLSGHALILGDSGVGKTTLVQRLTTAAGLEGAAISRVQCYDLEREIPYSTLSGLVLGLLDRPGVSATSPEALAEISRTVLEVSHRFPYLPAVSETRGETARIRLTEAFLQLLQAIAEEHPVILVLDDLHLADEVSLAVLHLIMRRAQGTPMMVVMIARAGELSQSSQAMRLRESVVPLSIRELELQPLDLNESHEMLRSLIVSDDSKLTDGVRKSMVRAAAGYPMVIELLVQDWRISKEHSLGLAMGAMTTSLRSQGSAHLAYRHILDRIYRSLDNTTQNVLNLAAVLGSRLTDLGMYALVDLSVGQTMTAMAELVARRVLRDGACGLEFVNELVRAAVYLDISPSVRRLLHSNIADRFIHEQSGTREDLELEIAWHCTRAGRLVEATPHLLAGARTAILAGAPYEAERGIATALGQLVGDDRSEALLLLAEALQEQSKWTDSLQVLDCEEARLSSFGTDIFLLRTRARRRLGLIDISEHPALAQQLLNLMRSNAEVVSKIRAGVEGASVLETMRCNSLAPAMLECLAELNADKLGLDDTVHLLLARSMLLYQMRDFAGSLECAREGVDLLEKNNHPNSVLAMLQNGVGAILAKQGFYDRAIPEYLKCYETSTRVANDWIYVQASANLSLSFMRVGDYERAISWGELSLKHGTMQRHYGFALQGAHGTVLSYAMTGQNRTRVEELIAETTSELAKRAPSGISQAWTLIAADAYALMGQHSEAEMRARQALQLECTPLDFFAGSYARWLAKTSFTDFEKKEAYRKIRSLLETLTRYDALDQADILAAKCWLDNQHRRFDLGNFRAMQEHLEALPRAAGEQLQRLGLLDFIDHRGETIMS
jgi:DNA-binding SARP family transcriptional activator/tetratricopeptide (TPR) repeat protein